MAYLIDKDAVVAEINNCIDKCNIKKQSCPVNTQVEAICDNKIHAYKELLSFINSQEIKEVDLEKALSDLDKDIKEFVTTEEFENESTTAGHYWVIAKHAFLLGLKAQK